MGQWKLRERESLKESTSVELSHTTLKYETIRFQMGEECCENIFYKERKIRKSYLELEARLTKKKQKTVIKKNKVTVR